MQLNAVAQMDDHSPGVVDLGVLPYSQLPGHFNVCFLNFHFTGV